TSTDPYGIMTLHERRLVAKEPRWCRRSSRDDAAESRPNRCSAANGEYMPENETAHAVACGNDASSVEAGGQARVTECEGPWLEDARFTRALHLKTRGTRMRDPSNDYICRVKVFSMSLARPRYKTQLATPLVSLTPLPPEQAPPQ